MRAQARLYEDAVRTQVCMLVQVQAIAFTSSSFVSKIRGVDPQLRRRVCDEFVSATRTIIVTAVTGEGEGKKACRATHLASCRRARQNARAAAGSLRRPVHSRIGIFERETRESLLLSLGCACLRNGRTGLPRRW